VLRLHVLPVIGDRPISTIRPTDIQPLGKALDATKAPGTVGEVYKVWDRACRAISADLEMHTLQHFYASALIAGGASVKVI
jgi:hypothetical protein